ncbi:MAG TPA: T9SS type A sorting domain-containing protein, partial [Bacteroidia bacterium]|nr:T9SS type A sorting domain-containing protein [Bacteroidia bacterium]
SPTYFNWGGIDLDCKGDIYIGDSSRVGIYDSTLTFKSSIALTGNIYDLKATNSGLLYACGKGFVSAVSIASTGCIDSTCSGLLTSINTITNNNSISIYPNPNTGRFTITTKGINENTVLAIYNVLGQEVYTETLKQTQDNYNIDLNSQPKGIYLYRILTEKGLLIYTGKLVIQ